MSLVLNFLLMGAMLWCRETAGYRLGPPTGACEPFSPGTDHGSAESGNGGYVLVLSEALTNRRSADGSFRYEEGTIYEGQLRDLPT